MAEILCYNKGCGQTYDPQANTNDSCRYHPGVPVFHDALKGWSCCKKRSTDFSEFLSIPGCTSGTHSHEKPAAPVQPVVETSKEPSKSKPKTDDEPDVPKFVETPMVEPVSRPSVEEPMVRLKTTISASLKQALEKQMQQLEISEKKSEEADTGVKVGEPCKNNNCSKSYNDSSSNDETCTFHPGGPVFHEGMKFWSCCRRKTSDFNNFLSQEGCTQGRHTWIKKEDPNKKVACRFDWHQTPGFVTMSIYSKVCEPDQTWVEVNQVAINIHVTFDQGKSVFEKSFPLRGIIDPAKSGVKLLGTKVEINMKKAEVGKWPTLELVSENEKSADDE